ncbi:MAG: BatA and WFA domain-containing protein [Chloroflexi bacterium]|nr:BatA and WFA domain-containing protein [Chloroflexota bacterium]
MTFPALTFQQPNALWLLGLIPLIVLLHVLRAAARRHVVPTVFLWRDLGHDADMPRRVRLPRLTLVLLLQLLAVAAAAFALASPRITAPPGRHLVLLLDASGSMLATDASPTRFDEAVRRARGLLTGLGPGDVASVVRVGAHPTPLAAAADSATALTSLGGVQAGGAQAAMREALFVGADLARRTPERAPELVVLSDGAFADPGDLSALGVPVRFETIGVESANRAIVSLGVARQPGASGDYSAFAQIANYASRPIPVGATLYVDDVTIETRSVTLPAQGRAAATFDVPRGARRVAVRLSGGDALPADDLAEVNVDTGYVRNVLLVARQPEALERALKAIPDLKVDTMTPERYDGSGAEIVVFDGVLPDRLPSGQLILVNPPPNRPFLPVGKEVQGVQFSDYDARHPLLQAIDLSAIRLAKAAPFEPPAWAKVVAEAPDGPLIVEGREEGRSVVGLGFEPSDSGIDRMIAFPLLVANAISFLGGGDLSPSLPPGKSVTLPTRPGVREVLLDLLGGEKRRLPVENGNVRLDGLDQPGRYVVREQGSGAGDPRVFSINLTDEVESAIAPHARPPIAAVVKTGEDDILTPLEVWPYLVGLGLLLLTLEWWRFGRRS